MPRIDDTLAAFIEGLLDELIEEFREAEEREDASILERYEAMIRDELLHDPHQLKYLVGLSKKKHCSLLVSTAAVYAFRLKYLAP
jgi:hypothetical protein